MDHIRWVVAVDADVLFKFGIRNLLFELAFLGVIRLVIGVEVAAEAKRNLAKVNKKWADAFSRQVSYLDDAMPETIRALQGDETSYDNAHPKDAHVALLAVEAEAHFLVTHNMRHFDDSDLKADGVHLVTPDQLMGALDSLYPGTLAEAFALQISSMNNPPISVEHYCDRIAASGCVGVASMAREYRAVIEKRAIEIRASKSRSPG